MFNKIFFSIGVFVAITLASTVADSTAAFDFVKFNYDARSVALGGAGSTDKSGRVGLLRNPALASTSNKHGVFGSFEKRAGDITLGAMSGSYHFSNNITLSPSVRYVSVGSITALDSRGDTLGSSIEPFSVMSGLAVSYPFTDEFYVGVATSFGYEYLSPEIAQLTEEISASALLFDMGFYFEPSRNVALSGGFRNVGFFLRRFDEDESSLPSSLYSGFRYYARGNLSMNFMVEAEKIKYEPMTVAPGMEFLLYKEIVALRIGTSFSSEDFVHFIGVLGGKGKQEFEYSKSDSRILSLGGGVKVPFNDKALFVDFASSILADGMGVNLLFSGGFTF